MSANVPEPAPRKVVFSAHLESSELGRVSGGLGGARRHGKLGNSNMGSPHVPASFIFFFFFAIMTIGLPNRLLPLSLFYDAVTHLCLAAIYPLRAVCGVEGRLGHVRAHD